jgi:Glycosyl transferase family 2
MIETLPTPAMTKLGIGIASSGRSCPVPWAIAMATQSYPTCTGLAWYNIVGHSIDDARNEIIRRARSQKLKYMWFVDDDTEPPRDAVRKLMYLLDQEEARGSSIVAAGGIYCVKQDPPTPNVFAGPGRGPFWRWKVGDVFPCWGIGTGCLLIRMDVFDQIPEPWFKTTSEPGFSETDDLYFCEKLARAGYGVLAHGGVLCPHWEIAKGEMTLKDGTHVSAGMWIKYTLPSDSYPMLPREPTAAQLEAVIKNQNGAGSHAGP